MYLFIKLLEVNIAHNELGDRNLLSLDCYNGFCYLYIIEALNMLTDKKCVFIYY